MNTAAFSKIKLTLLAALLAFLTLTPPATEAEDGPPVHKLKVPQGFRVSCYATRATGARSLTRGDSGTVYVGTRDEFGYVYAVPDADRDGRGDRVITLLKGLFQPNGVEWSQGSLFVGEVNRILRYDNIDASLASPPRPVVVNDTLPRRTHHGQKYIRFGPDGRLYIPVGAPCNVCLESDPRFATLMSMKRDGSDLKIYASGIRNTVGFDWQPGSGQLFFTDNGRDYLGDNLPPEELNCAPFAGMHFGFPFIHAGDIPDPEFGRAKKISEFTAPVLKMPAHVAPLGIKFYRGTMFPESYKNCAFICEHGSWNRSSPIGYRVSAVTFQNGKPVKYEPFITGWLDKGNVWGRPVDLLVLPDGSLLVSDDHAGCIYRVTYQKPAPESKKR